MERYWCYFFEFPLSYNLYSSIYTCKCSFFTCRTHIHKTLAILFCSEIKIQIKSNKILWRDHKKNTLVSSKTDMLNANDIRISFLLQYSNCKGRHSSIRHHCTTELSHTDIKVRFFISFSSHCVVGLWRIPITTSPAETSVTTWIIPASVVHLLLKGPPDAWLSLLAMESCISWIGRLKYIPYPLFSLCLLLSATGKPLEEITLGVT